MNAEFTVLALVVTRLDALGVAYMLSGSVAMGYSKLDWVRDSRSELQLRDVRNLLDSVPDLDRDYLDRWVAALDLRALFEAARA